MSQQHLVEVNKYSFSFGALDAMRGNAHANNNWPLVYVLSDGARRHAYIGETTDAITRLGTHLRHPHKKQLTTVHLVSSDCFNKSATLDIESGLIKYMAADGCFRLLNGNLGIADHNYYQKDDLYSKVFRDTWDKLRAEGIAQHSLESIDNSDVFKYSPYKSLSYDQRQGLIEIMRGLLEPGVKNLVVEGGAGTGKSVLAIFLFKLIHSDQINLELRDFSEEEGEVYELLEQLKQRYPKPRMALVVPMGSFRSTLKKAFRNVAGLSPSMVISPADLVRQHYDIVLVDESHRLRKRVNLGAYYGAFDRACAALGLDKENCSEVDWVQQQSGKAVYFYDPTQSIKPSDANAEDFQNIKTSPTSRVMQLESQFRVRAGKHFVGFIDALLNVRLASTEKFKSKNYEFLLFDNLSDMIEEIGSRNKKYGLARLVAGFAWPWRSKGDCSVYDIEIEGVKLRWNSTNKDWINSPGAEHEVGCIHTTQGYDLNYTGVIFGKEIRYDKKTDRIVIDAANYHDRNGKQTIQDPEELKRYILNIYRTIMLRGIRGSFLYACDAGLRDFLRKYVPVYQPVVVKFPVQVEKPKPYENAVPLYDLKAAAGGFSELQHVEHEKWVVVPEGVPVEKDIFACHVVGESMNKIIPNGSTCFFRLDHGGTRNGKIVLVECADVQDGDEGYRYTVKDYESVKVETEDGWQHQRIFLKPRSTDPDIPTIEIDADNEHRYTVVGVYVGRIAEG